MSVARHVFCDVVGAVVEGFLPLGRWVVVPRTSFVVTSVAAVVMAVIFLVAVLISITIPGVITIRSIPVLISSGFG
jgi:hypothetical protein